MPSTAGGGLLADHQRRGQAGIRGAIEAPPATLLFVALAALSAGVLLLLGSRLTFLLDDWEFLVYRPGFSDEAILGPHNEHIVVIPVLLYKALLATVGMDSALPFRVASTVMFILSVALLFVYLRRRVGDWLALAGAASLLFLGPAWEDLLWPFQIGYFGSMVCGLGALLALEREQRGADAIACALLAVSLGFSSLGLPFAAAIAISILLGARERWLARAYVVALPIALFAVWWLGWGRDAESSISLANIASAPLYVVDGFATALASLFGLATPRDEIAIEPLDWGRPLLAAAVALGGWRLWKLGRLPPGLVVVGTLALSFWLLAGVNEKEGRDATASRYVYVGVIFVLMIAAELLRGVRPGRWALAGTFAVLAITVASNLSFLNQAYGSYKATSDLERADLAAIEIARDMVEPGFRLDAAFAQTIYVGIEAGPYLAAADEFGSPAFTVEELAAAPEPARFAADVVLSRALGITFTHRPVGGFAGGPAPVQVSGAAADSVTRGSCLELGRALGREPRVVELPPGGAILEAAPGAAVEARLRRFAVAGFPVEAGIVDAGGTVVLDIPTDRATVPWALELRSAGPLGVCGRLVS